MKDFFLHLFTPKESNNHRAKVLHHTNLLLTIVFLLLASFLIQGIKVNFPSVLGIKADISSEELLLLTNKERQNVGIGPLIFNEKLSEAAIKKAELKDFRFHDLRHSAASYLAMNGASLAEIAEVLGHKTLAMVKRYAHLSEAHTAKVVERMNQKIFG